MSQSTASLLIELGTEELPPKALKTLALAFKSGIENGLKERALTHEAVKWFATPRRLAVLVQGLIAQAPDETVEVNGPPADKAKDADGNWSKAVAGFARKQGVAPEELISVDTPKGPRLSVRLTRAGANTREAVPAVVDAAIAALPIPKRMRWGASRAEFVRPVHWVVMLYGADVIDTEVLGIRTGRDTRGHRFHCDRALPLASADDYQLTLENQAHVVADYNERRGMIREQVIAAGERIGGQAVIDEDLLDEVTALVEWPVALTGSFEKRFLDVPPEALISSMKEHQKYFHAVDADNRLLPHFITVSNIESTDPAQVIDGNERVIRPRLSDAAFFFETDKKTPLAERVQKLKSIVFQKQLGTLYDKTQRVQALAETIAGQIGGDSAKARRAGLLAKADLVSDMVFEFDTMQGIAGYYYALHDGEDDEVARALQEQYLPRFAGDELPHTDTGCAVALADRLDTLVGIFGIGQPPTGSKDPFALRRATLGILRIIVEKQFELDLREVLEQAAAQYSALPAAEALVDTVLDYMVERFRAWYEEENIPVAVFTAVTAKRLSAPLDIDRRVHAVHQFNRLPQAQALAAANKRVSNILAKQGGELRQTAVDESLLQEAAEKALASALAAKTEAAAPLFADKQYAEGLSQLAELQGPVDHFFDHVMVMAEDPALRNNRLALLKSLRDVFLQVADISHLVPAK